MDLETQKYTANNNIIPCSKWTLNTGLLGKDGCFKKVVGEADALLEKTDTHCLTHRAKVILEQTKDRKARHETLKLPEGMNNTVQCVDIRMTF